MIKTSEKIKLIAQRQKLTLSELAQRSGQSRQNLSNKLERNNFTEDDLRKIADAIDAELVIDFLNRETGKPII